ncbi:MAG: hypothetical protein ACYS1A_12170, partial [Planctomycetota bacterium]
MSTVPKVAPVRWGCRGVNIGLVLMKASLPGDTRSWMALNAEVESVSVVGIEDLKLSLSDFSIRLNQAGGGSSEVVNFATSDINENGAPDVVHIIDVGDGETIEIDYTSAFSRVGGTVAIELAGFVYLSGDFAFEKSSTPITVTLADAVPTTAEVEMLTVGAANVSAFVGVNGPANNSGAMGVSFTGIDFGLAMMKVFDPAPGDTRSWMALATTTTAGLASVVGIEGFELTVNDFTLEVNHAGGDDNGAENSAINFIATDFGTYAGIGGGLRISTGSSSSIEILSTDEILSVSGDLGLDISGFVVLEGTFAFEKSGEPVTITLTDSSTVDVEVLTISAIDAAGFAGVNGPAGNAGAMGISLSGVNFGLILMNVADPLPGDNRSWTALKAEVGSIDIVGIQGFELTIESFGLELNKAGGDINGFANREVVDFVASDMDDDGEPDEVHIVDVGGGNTVEMNFDGDLFRVGGTIGIELDGFVYLSGDFAFEKSNDPVTVKLADDDPGTVEDDSTTVEVEIMTIAAKDVKAFAGVNGPADQDGAMGLSLSGVDIAVVLMKVSEPSPGDTRSWMALKAEADDISFIGIEDITISLTDFAVLFNRADGDDNGAENYVVNFATSDFDGDTEADEAYSIEIGEDESIEIDFADELLKVGGTVEIGLAGFVYVSGDFAFEKSSDPVTVTLADDDPATVDDDSTIVEVEMLTVGAANVNAFVGVNGPASNSGAMGVSFSEVEFGLVLMKVSDPVPNDTRSWMALVTEVGQAEVVGIDGFELEVSSFTLEVNQARGDDNGADNAAVDFDKTDFGASAGISGGLEIVTGPSSSKEILFADEVFNVYGTLSLNVFGFFYVSGEFALEKDSSTVTLVDTAGDVNVEMLKLGATGLNAFAGVNGPASQPGAVGFSLTNVQFGLALIKAVPDPVDIQPDLRSWTVLQANVQNATFDGITGVDIDVNGFELKINRPGGTNDGLANTRAIDFSGAALHIATSQTTGIDITFGKALFEASGNIGVNLFDFVDGSADFAFSKQTIDVDVDANGIFDPAAGDLDDAELVVFGLSNTSVFVGSGGVGFNITDGQLGIAQIKPNSDTVDAGDTRSYLAVRADLDSASLDGIDGLIATALNLSVDINDASGAYNSVDASALDWSAALALETGSGFGSVLDIGTYLDPPLVEQELLIDFNQELFQASGRFELDIFGFITGNANFAFVKQTVDLELSSTETLADASMIIIALSDVDVFVGVGDVGFQVTDGQFGLAHIKSTVTGDSRSYLGIKASLADASLVGIDGLTASVSNVSVLINQASGDDGFGLVAEPLDWSSMVEFDDANGVTFGDVVDPGKYLDPAVDLTLDYTGELFQAGGSIDLDLFDLVTGSGDFVFRKQEVSVKLSDTETLSDASMIVLAMNNVNASVGINGVGFAVDDGKLGLVQIKPSSDDIDAGDSRSYLAVKGSLGGADLVGIDGLEASVSNLTVQINSASGDDGFGLDAEPLDWSKMIEFDDSNGIDFNDTVDPGKYLVPPLTAQELAIDYTAYLLQVSGHINLDLFGFVDGQADFAFKQETIDVDLDGSGTIDGDDLTDASLITFALNSADLFIGVNGIGFDVDDAQLGLAYIKSTEAGDTRSYLGLKGIVGSAAFVGISAFDIELNSFIVQINQANGAKGVLAAEALDWTSALNLDDDPTFGEVADVDENGIYGLSDDLLDPGLNFDPALTGQELALDLTSELLQVKSFMTLEISEFVFVTGSFAFTKSEPIYVTTAGSTTSMQVSLMTVGASNVYAFAGVGGPYWVDGDGDGQIASDEFEAEGALGVALSEGSFGMALMSPVAGGGPNYYALKASGSVKLIGIEGLVLEAKDMCIEVNKSSDAGDVIDFTQLLPDGKMLIPTGPDTEDVELDYDDDLIQVMGSVTLTISEFVHVSGSFAFEQGPTEDVVLSNGGGVVNVSVLKVGVSNGYAFAGVGGSYWVDSNLDGVVDELDTPDTDGAMGIALGGVEFGMALMKRTTGSTANYYALKAGGNAELVGIDGLNLSVQSMEFQINGTTDDINPDAVVDFAETYQGDPVGMQIITGTASEDVIYLDFNGKLLQVSGTATLTISEFVHISGNFTFQKGQELGVTVIGEVLPVDVSLMTIGASEVYAFVGLGGPYWVDSDDDGFVIDPDTAGAIGLAVDNVEFALALAKPTEPDATESYYALKATGAVELVGVTGVTLSANDILIEVNATTGDDPNAVIDFDASFAGDGLEVKTGDGKVEHLNFTEDKLLAMGHFVLTIADSINIEADLSFELTTNEYDVQIIKVAFAGAKIFFGGTNETDSIVWIENGTGLFVINDKGMAGELSITPHFNIPSLIINFGEISVAVNTTGQAIYEEFDTPDGTKILDLPAGPYVRIRALETETQALELGFEVNGTPYTISATALQFEQATLPDSSTVVKIAATGLAATIPGDGELSNGWGGFIFYSDGMAGMAKGDITLFSGTIEGEVAFFVNTTDRTIDDKIFINGTDLRINVGPNTIGFSATDATLQFGDYVVIKGDYTVQSVDQGLPTERTLYGARNVRIFMGRGPPELEDGTTNPAAVGVLVQATELGVVKYADDTYALYATGQASIIGLGDGIYVEGTLQVKINTTGRAVNEIITIPDSGTIDVVFTSPQRVEIFEGGVTLGVGKVGSDYIFEISGTIRFSRDPIGQVQVDVPEASVSINIPDGSGGLQSAFSISGSASFAFGGAQGFRLQDLRVNGFSVFGVSASIPQPASSLRPPTADLNSPYNGQVVDVQELNDHGYIEVVFNDVNRLGLNEGTITDDTQEFILMINGHTPDYYGLVINGRAQKVGQSNVYRYQFIGTFPEGDVQLKFLPQAWSDISGTNNVVETEHFTIAAEDGEGNLPAPAPTAMLSNPANGASVNVDTLIGRGYIDVTFLVPSGYDLDTNSITGQEFDLTGSDVGVGVGDAQVSTPMLISGTTYRYHITDSDSNNDVDIFTAGEVTVQFHAGRWTVKEQGNPSNTISNAAGRAQFTVQSGSADTAKATNEFTIGPLVLGGPSIGLADMGFNENKLVLTVGIGVELARLSFGSQQGSSGITAELTGVLGTFDIEVDVLALLGGDFLNAFNVPGKFGLKIDGLDVNIPNVVRVTAAGIDINYDPNYDPAEHSYQPQEILSLESASISFERFNITGSISPYDGKDGLIIRTDGFWLGQADISYNGIISLGGIIEFNGIKIGVQGLDVVFGQGLDFDGNIFIASGGASFFPGRPISATISDGSDADNDALSVTLDFEDGKVKDLIFEVDTFEITL